MRETVTLNIYKPKRVMVLNRIVAGQLSIAEAGALLELSQRQVKHILAAYRVELSIKRYHAKHVTVNIFYQFMLGYIPSRSLYKREDKKNAEPIPLGSCGS